MGYGPCNAHQRWDFIIGFNIHDGIVVVPPVFTPCKLPHITAGPLQGLWLGANIANVSGRETLGHDSHLMGRGTDAGFVFPHVSIPPNNILLPLTFLLGGSQALIGSHKTKLFCWSIFGEDDEHMGTTCFPCFLGLNLACWDPIPLPTEVIIAAPQTVVADLTLDDLWACLIDVAIELAFVGITAGLGAGAGKIKKTYKANKAKKAGSKTAKEIAEGTGDAIADAADPGFVKNALKKSVADSADGADGAFNRFKNTVKNKMYRPKVAASDRMGRKLDAMDGSMWSKVKDDVYDPDVKKFFDPGDAAHKADVNARLTAVDDRLARLRAAKTRMPDVQPDIDAADARKVTKQGEIDTQKLDELDPISNKYGIDTNKSIDDQASDLAGKVDAKKAELDNATKRLDDLSADHTAKVDQLNTQIDAKDARKAELSQHKADIDAERATLDGELSDASTRYSQSEHRVAMLESNQQRLQRELSEATDDATKRQVQDQLDDVTQELGYAKTARDAALEERREILDSLDRLRLDSDRIAREIDQIDVDIKQLRDDIDAAKMKFDRDGRGIADDIDRLEAEHRAIDADRAKFEAEMRQYNTLKGQMDAIDDELARLNREKADLEASFQNTDTIDAEIANLEKVHAAHQNLESFRVDVGSQRLESFGASVKRWAKGMRDKRMLREDSLIAFLVELAKRWGIDYPDSFGELWLDQEHPAPPGGIHVRDRKDPNDGHGPRNDNAIPMYAELPSPNEAMKVGQVLVDEDDPDGGTTSGVLNYEFRIPRGWTIRNVEGAPGYSALKTGGDGSDGNEDHDFDRSRHWRRVNFDAIPPDDTHQREEFTCELWQREIGRPGTQGLWTWAWSLGDEDEEDEAVAEPEDPVIHDNQSPAVDYLRRSERTNGHNFDIPIPNDLPNKNDFDDATSNEFVWLECEIDEPVDDTTDPVSVIGGSVENIEYVEREPANDDDPKIHILKIKVRTEVDPATSEGDTIVTIDPALVTDLAGNTGVALDEQNPGHTYRIFVNHRPRVDNVGVDGNGVLRTRMLGDWTYGNADDPGSCEIQITFNEPLGGGTTPYLRKRALTVTGGRIDGDVTQVSPDVYTVRITPDEPDAGATTTVTLTLNDDSVEDARGLKNLGDQLIWTGTYNPSPPVTAEIEGRYNPRVYHWEHINRSPAFVRIWYDMPMAADTLDTSRLHAINADLGHVEVDPLDPHIVWVELTPHECPEQSRVHVKLEADTRAIQGANRLDWENTTSFNFYYDDKAPTADRIEPIEEVASPTDQRMVPMRILFNEAVDRSMLARRLRVDGGYIINVKQVASIEGRAYKTIKADGSSFEEGPKHEELLAPKHGLSGVYEFTLVLTKKGEVRVWLDEGAVPDLAGNMSTGSPSWAVIYDPGENASDNPAARYGLTLPAIGHDPEIWPDFESAKNPFSAHAKAIWASTTGPSSEGRPKLSGELLEIGDIGGMGSTEDDSVGGGTAGEAPGDELPWQWNAHPLDVPPWMRPAPAELPPWPDDMSPEEIAMAEEGLEILAEIMGADIGELR